MAQMPVPPGIIPDMASMANRGLGSIGRDYNIQLDKVEKYRREGTWTEADESEWAKKKPFPCEICGDRVSSRVRDPPETSSLDHWIPFRDCC